MEEKPCIIHITTYPPRECGLATFSADLIRYFDELFLGKVETKIVAMNTGMPPKYTYPDKVILEINQNEKTDYISVAEKLNSMPEVKLVSIQHEFGIFGDNYGENIIYFLEKIQKPITVTLHTVLSSPHEDMKKVMEKIITKANRLIVMTELSKKILIDVYGAIAEKVNVIPHGIHPQTYTDSKIAQKKLGFENKTIITTFGLLSRGKGIEHGLEAMPEIIKRYPNVLYLVVGGTHPVILRNEGETYRNELVASAKKLGIEKNVIFHNEYLSTEKLLTFLEATDIYLSLSQNPNQAVSGTLTYALGAGRAVISTPFMQAKEIITNDVGILVDFNDHKRITTSVLELLDDTERRLSMGKSAYFQTRIMTWPNVALAYMRTYKNILPSLSETNKYLQPIKIDYLKKLTDGFGVLQFASLNDPDLSFGYTLDDNARALVAMCWYNQLHPSNETSGLINTFLTFIETSAKAEGGFNNYFDEKREPHIKFNKDENLEDSNARALWALAVACTNADNTKTRERAFALFEKEFTAHQDISSPRAVAFYIKAFSKFFLHHERFPDITTKIEKYADFLIDIFQKTNSADWVWFEESLTYSNAILPESLINAYIITKKPIYLEVAKKSLDFLITKSFEGDMCVPVGQAGWYTKGKEKQRYDQQPEEVSALVLALHKMSLISENSVEKNMYEQKLLLAFDWFMGNNLSKQLVYTHSTGGCYDGIRENGINLNQGSESTISYLLARLIMEK